MLSVKLDRYDKKDTAIQSGESELLSTGPRNLEVSGLIIRGRFFHAPSKANNHNLSIFFFFGAFDNLCSWRLWINNRTPSSYT